MVPGHQSACGTQKTPCGLGILEAGRKQNREEVSGTSAASGEPTMFNGQLLFSGEIQAKKNNKNTSKLSTRQCCEGLTGENV